MNISAKEIDIVVSNFVTPLPNLFRAPARRNLPLPYFQRIKIWARGVIAKGHNMGLRHKIIPRSVKY